MNDLISRQAAVEALTGWETEPLDEDIVRTLNNLPPVTPTEFNLEKYSDGLWRIAYDRGYEQGREETERTGEWMVEEKDSIYGKKIRLTCSECGDVFDVTESAYPYERYCRYCGAKMKG